MTAILLQIGACFCFICIDSSAKWLVTSGLPTFEVVFVRYAGHLLVVSALMAPLAAPGRGASPFRTNNLQLEIIRGALLMLSTMMNFLALRELPLSLTVSIMFTAPLFVTAFSIPLLGERVGWRRWAAICVGFSGVLVALRPGAEAVPLAAIYSLGAATSSALYFILTRKLAGVDGANTQQFYAALVASLALAPLAVAVWTWPSDPVDWAVFCAIGVFGWIGHQCATVAHRLAPASILAPFFYSQIVFMPLASWLIFDQPPDLWIMLGASIVTGSGLYIWLRERTLKKGEGQ